MDDPTSDLLLLDDLLGEEERAVRDRVRRFCDERVRPVINEHREKAAFTGHGLPGLSPLAAGLVSMELARGDGSAFT